MNIKVNVRDDWLSERELPLDPLDLIKDQFKLLERMRDDGRKPSAHLLQDIRIYKYILTSPNSSDLAWAYMEKMNELREKHGTFKVKKIDAIRELGWPVK